MCLTGNLFLFTIDLVMQLIISAQEAADVAGMSRRRINQLVLSGKIEGQQIGKSNVIKYASLLRWLENRPKRGPKLGSKNRKRRKAA